MPSLPHPLPQHPCPRASLLPEGPTHRPAPSCPSRAPGTRTNSNPPRVPATPWGSGGGSQTGPPWSGGDPRPNTLIGRTREATTASPKQGAHRSQGSACFFLKLLGFTCTRVPHPEAPQSPRSRVRVSRRRGRAAFGAQGAAGVSSCT